MATQPKIYGYGIRSCSEYHLAFYDKKTNIVDYKNWFEGFISALNLATDQTLLAHLNWQQISQKLALQCEDQRHIQFIDAIRALIRLDSKIKSK